MIELSVLDNILKKYTKQGMLSAAKYQFNVAYNTQGEPFVGDLEYKNFSQVPQDLLQAYLKEGYNNLSVASESLPKKKQFDPMVLPQGFVAYTGFLGKEAVIGVDRSKEHEKSVNIYTRSEKILRELFDNGAFEDKFTKDDLDKIIEKMEKKIGTGVAKGALAFARLDIVNAMRDSVVYKITLPNFRVDVGDTLKFYPYGIFPYLSSYLIATIKDSAFTIMQKQPDGNIKVRKSSFTDKAVNILYKGFEKALVKSKLKKAHIGWDVLSLNIKAHNLEASLYTTGYTNINLEDVIQITGCELSEVDKTQYAVNYDDLRGHFKTCVNNRWKTADFLDFKALDLSGFANNQDRKDAAMVWVEKADNANLYNIMAAQPELFGDMIESLNERERRSPKEFKKLEYVDLPEETQKRVNKVREMLQKGVVKITKTSKKSNKVSEVLCTNNNILLSRILGKNYVENYESVGIKINYLRNILDKTNIIDDFTQLEDKIYSMGLDDYINIADLDRVEFEKIAVQNKVIEDNVTKELMKKYEQKLRAKGTKTNEEIQKEMALPKIERRYRTKAKTAGKYLSYLQASSVIEAGKGNVREYPVGNPNLIRYKKVYADSDKDFYGSVDIDNIISVEYAELGK